MYTEIQVYTMVAGLFTRDTDLYYLEIPTIVEMVNPLIDKGWYESMDRVVYTEHITCEMVQDMIDKFNSVFYNASTIQVLNQYLSSQDEKDGIVYKKFYRIP